jgi:hypothetical protein
LRVGLYCAPAFIAGILRGMPATTIGSLIAIG